MNDHKEKWMTFLLIVKLLFEYFVDDHEFLLQGLMCHAMPRFQAIRSSVHRLFVPFNRRCFVYLASRYFCLTTSPVLRFL